ncbi:MAG: methionine biosynthesis protein MetW [Flavobacteriales bacterium TMED235]|jgi:methionine biosynthesis protein MetW|nr:MAG: methionine biosynthesis protein MetW [Flavobacteriales bacterium TMED235]|tara:strand:- start:3702 stop:4256 length:555 start_codon:yes stop_codon:yes gene_type:complete
MKKEFYNIAKLVTQNSKILDVGCGNGELMKYITENISKDIRGIELSKSNVQKCVEKGLTVIEGNAEKDLKQFPDNSFDFVILSQTLQAFLDPENVLNELLRIGKKAIVSIPNFGHWKVRLHLLLKGTMPVTENLPNEWYNTPNLHMCTIKDFENYCKGRDIKINLKNLRFHNFFSELGIFVLEK